MRSGAWTSDPSVMEYKAVTVVLNTNRKSELISIDGEPVEMKMPLRCTLIQQALEVIVPMSEAASGPAEKAA
jgi:diacylglycerol kinase family enzyme